MKVILKNIASVKMGYSFRRRLESSHKGGVSVIQMKDLAENNYVDCTELANIEKNNIQSGHYVKQGDIIFRSRGRITQSAILKEDGINALVAAPLLRIRVDNDKVLPAYLNWYINQKKAQAYLASRTMGTSIKMISKQSIEEMEIEIPGLVMQKRIVDITRLLLEEKRIEAELKCKKEQYLSELLIRAIKEK